MLSIKQATKSKRVLISPHFLFNNTTPSFSIPFPSTSPPFLFSNGNNPIQNLYLDYCFCCCYHYSTASIFPIQQVSFGPSFSAREVVQSFKDWFKRRQNGSLDRIFQILGKQDEVDELAMAQLGLHLTEQFVLEVLRHGKNQNEVLSCLKFFDWAGRQHGFIHTRATYFAIFKILSKAKLMTLMLDFLRNYTKLRYLNPHVALGFYPTLVMGYSVAGKPQVALQLFGRMRFQGQDLDPFVYHVLLNSLVEEGCFDAVKEIARQISFRGFKNSFTHRILVRSFCKQKKLNDAESYLRQVIVHGDVYGLGHAVEILVDAFCQKGQFEKAGLVIEECSDLGVEPMAPAYGVWLKTLVRVGKLDVALEFMKQKSDLQCYVPDVSQYNVLLGQLLIENRLIEACDLLMKMVEGGILPNKGTMNATLCFFCKAGMVDVALELYKCKSEFGLSHSSMACNYLINALCEEGNVDEAYHVLKNSAEHGYFPGKRTFSVLIDALCREGKLDMMEELLHVALERNLLPTNTTYDKFISALCRARRVEDGYLLYWELNRMNKNATRSIYTNLIRGFIKLNRVDIAARLLIEMQQKGHVADRPLFRSVICGLCKMENLENKFFTFLDMHLCLLQPNCQLYNYFIDGAGHANKPELAREVFKMMERSGIKPTLSSDILMLQSYLKNERTSDALNFFDTLQQRGKIGRKLYHTIIVGLCKIGRVDHALPYFCKMRSNGLVPSVECYEELIQQLCSIKQYDQAVDLINNLIRDGRRVTSFIGNILLLNSLRSQDLYDAWIQGIEVDDGTSSNLSLLQQVIGAFSGRVRFSQEVDNLEEVIEQCFPLDIFTYNLLLRRLMMSQVEDAYELRHRICQKGFEPNRWTYDAFVHGLLKHGMDDEADRLLDEMLSKGFDLTPGTKRLMSR